jgi:hypothetical protein
MPGPPLPDLDGVPNDPGGTPSGGGSGTSPANLANLPTTGGLTGATAGFLFVGFDEIIQQNMVYLLDASNFNTEEDVEYDFKVEELEPGNEGTIHRIVLRYRDLGPVTFTVAAVSADRPNLDYTKGTGNAVFVTVGNNPPTEQIFTKKIDLKVTTEAPQIKVFRAANAGPMSITKVKPWISYGDGDII